MNESPRILILYPEVPGVTGGTERLAESLCNAFVSRGVEAAVLTLPYHWEPKEIVIGEALAWRMLEVEAELVIPLKFPAYFIKHPRKVVWLQHQFRQIYDFFGTHFSGFSNNMPDGELREKLVALDNYVLSESAHIYTNSANTLKRLENYNGIKGSVLYPPPSDTYIERSASYDDFILAVGRLEEVKRFDLLLQATALAKNEIKVKIAGNGSQQNALQNLAKELGISGQVEFLGYVEDAELADLYSRCRAVHFTPMDEDYGLIAVEAMRAGKPVITADDSGGPLEFVRNGVNGIVAPATADDQAKALDRLWADMNVCKQLGTEAAKTVEMITWDKTFEEFCRWLP